MAAHASPAPWKVPPHPTLSRGGERAILCGYEETLSPRGRGQGEGAFASWRAARPQAGHKTGGRSRDQPPFCHARAVPVWST